MEIGVGSGAISCLLLWRDKGLIGDGIDVDRRCVELCEKNLDRVIKGWKERYKVHSGDFMEVVPSMVEEWRGKYDFIVSNPPYIGETEYDGLERQVKQFESKTALYSPDDGIYHSMKILELCRPLLTPEGFICMELSPPLIARYRLLQSSGQLSSLGYFIHRVDEDYYGKERFIMFKQTEQK